MAHRLMRQYLPPASQVLAQPPRCRVATVNARHVVHSTGTSTAACTNQTMKTGSLSPWVVAIDGPAGSGKGTLARSLAAIFNLAHLDTGLLYRAVGYKALQSQVDLTDDTTLATIASSLQPQDLSDPKLRGDEAASAASKVSAVPRVRSALLDYQRTFAANPPGGFQGAVLDGRDIGTKICPNAHVKIFVTASVEVRAQRRLLELQSKGQSDITYDKVLKDMQERDARDSSRAEAPLAKASDAVELDTSSMDAQQALDAAVQLVRQHCAGIKEIMI